MENSREMRELVSYLRNEADFATKLDMQRIGTKVGAIVVGAVAALGTALAGLSQYVTYTQLNKVRYRDPAAWTWLLTLPALDCPWPSPGAARLLDSCLLHLAHTDDRRNPAYEG